MNLLEWQKIGERHEERILVVEFRARVPGGWLVKTVSTMTGIHPGYPSVVAKVFLPDPDNEWGKEFEWKVPEPTVGQVDASKVRL
jgi:hypothetical protein